MASTQTTNFFDWINNILSPYTETPITNFSSSTWSDGKLFKSYLKALFPHDISPTSSLLSDEIAELLQKYGMNKEKIPKTFPIENYNEEVMKSLLVRIAEIQKRNEMIEKWTELVFEKKIFDSEINKWNVSDSEFEELLKNEEKIVVLIEEKKKNGDGNVFGVFVDEKVKTAKTSTNLMASTVRKSINFDFNGIEKSNKSFGFVLQSFDGFESFQKFNVNNGFIGDVFHIHEKNDEKLFSVGFGKDGKNADIVVMKDGVKNKNKCGRNCFDYPSNDKMKNYVFTGNKNVSQYFEINRFIVWKMKMSDEQEQKEKEQKMKEEEKKKFDEEQKWMNVMTNRLLAEENVLSDDEKYFKKLEIEITKKCFVDFKSVIFDSDKCSVSRGNSFFDKHLLGKENVIIECIDEFGNVFGCHLHNKIDSICSNETLLRNSIHDENAVLFMIQEFNPNYNTGMKTKKYKIKSTNSNVAFSLYERSDDILFRIGNNDVVLYKNKNDKLNKHYQCEITENSFDYCGKKSLIFNYLQNKSYQIVKEKILFKVNRIRVYEVTENEKYKEIDEKEQLEKRTKEFEEETKKLEKITNDMKTNENKQKLVKSIEQICGMDFDCVLFDTNCCKWKPNHSTFIQRINEKEKVVFVIENTKGDVFGCLINSKIDIPEKRNFNDRYCISDPFAMIFSLNSNLDQKQNTIYIRNGEKALGVFNEKSSRLFIIGEGDILIKKEREKAKCSCDQNSFHYIMDNMLLSEHLKQGGTNDNFEVKQIQVLKMNESEEQHKKNTERRPNFTEEKKIYREMKLVEEISNDFISGQVDGINENTSLEELRKRLEKCKDKLKKTSNNVNLSKERRILELKIMKKELEQVCRMEASEIIFDSNCCDWGIQTSTFDQYIFGKDHFAIVITDEKDNSFGVYISRKVTSIRHKIENKLYGDYVVDPDSFVFSLNNNVKFNIKQKFVDKSFIVYQSSFPKLFTIGDDDICIWKYNSNQSRKNYINNLNDTHEYSFDFGFDISKLNGKQGKINVFGIKNIRVVQMKESERMKKEKEQQFKEICENETKQLQISNN